MAKQLPFCKDCGAVRTANANGLCTGCVGERERSRLHRSRIVAKEGAKKPLPGK
jgi:hypothetical protein